MPALTVGTASPGSMFRMPFLAIVFVCSLHICADASRTRHLGEIATDAQRSRDVVDLINLDSAESQAQIARGFSLKELLREDPKNAALLQEYSKLLGEVVYSCETERDLLTRHQGDQPRDYPGDQPPDLPNLDSLPAAAAAPVQLEEATPVAAPMAEEAIANPQERLWRQRRFPAETAKNVKDLPDLDTLPAATAASEQLEEAPPIALPAAEEAIAELAAKNFQGAERQVNQQREVDKVSKLESELQRYKQLVNQQREADKVSKLESELQRYKQLVEDKPTASDAKEESAASVAEDNAAKEEDDNLSLYELRILLKTYREMGKPDGHPLIRDTLASIAAKEAEIQTQPHKGYLGEAAVVGEELLIRQAKPRGRKLFARLFTNRHDYAVEQITLGKATAKYGFTGKTWSLHNRMHFVKVGERKPSYVVRRAYNYLNPIARNFGQYVYRVIPFDAESKTGRKARGKYASDKVVYTITKDRFGKGLLWSKEEWRIYTGDGGCKHYGVTSCDPSKQVYYAMTGGLTGPEMSDAKVYKGQIKSIKHGVAHLSNGSNITKETLGIEYKVADIVHASGQNRILNWAVAKATRLTLFSPIWGIVAAAWADKYKLQFKQDTDEILMTMLAALMDVTHDNNKDSHHG